jgi:phosphoglycolate phosphatase
VGDTDWDYQAAQRAGVPFIHAAYGFGTVEGAPRLEKLSDLPELARRMSEQV